MKRRVMLCVAAVLCASDYASAQGVPDRVAELERLTEALTAEVTVLQQRAGGQAARIDDLRDRLRSLENAARGVAFDVDCGAGQTVASAVSEATGTGPVTIRITGVCREAVRIGRSDITLLGASGADGIEAPDADSPVMIMGARVVLASLTIQGGDVGISGLAGSHVTLESVRVSGARVHAVAVDGAVVVRNSVLDGNNEGVFAANGSTVSIISSTIANSTADGVFLTTGASAHIGWGSRIENNGHGVALRFGATLNLDHAVVAWNRFSGVSVAGASSVALTSATVIERNAINGVHLHDTSVAGAWIRAGADGPTITNNGGFGVQCTQAPGVAQVVGGLAGPGLLWGVSGNGLGDVKCPVSQGP